MPADMLCTRVCRSVRVADFCGVIADNDIRHSTVSSSSLPHQPKTPYLAVSRRATVTQHGRNVPAHRERRARYRATLHSSRATTSRPLTSAMSTHFPHLTAHGGTRVAATAAFLPSFLINRIAQQRRCPPSTLPACGSPTWRAAFCSTCRSVYICAPALPRHSSLPFCLSTM